MSIVENTPNYLPARMLNEFVYCPRLFFYEWVEGVFVQNRETVEGSLRHSKLDQRDDSLPSAEVLQASGEAIHSRSVTLSSETHRLIAKMDLIEGDAARVSPVDYKRGAPRENRETGELEAWDADRVQLAVQALVLCDNGYECEEAVIYYVSTKQRVRVAIDQALVDFTLASMQQAREIAASGRIPPPLVDSPKCPRCSLVGVCLPDETRAVAELAAHLPAVAQQLLFDVGDLQRMASALPAKSDEEVRRLVPARDDLRPLYLNKQGVRVGKLGEVLKIHAKDKLLQEVRFNDICQLNLFGNIQVTTQTVQSLCEADIPIAYFSQGGWFSAVERPRPH